MQLVVNILVLASIYALIGCGYVLIYRVSRVLSLAHGELMMLGAYLLFTTASLFGKWPWLAIAVALALSLLVGLLVYLALMRKMAGERVFAAVLVTIALGILVRGVIALIWTGSERHPLEALGWRNASIALPGSAVISGVGLLTVVLAVAVYLGLFGFFRATRWGIRMRAVGENPLLAAQRGIELHLVYACAWAMATLTGGMVGMLLAADQGLDSTMAVIGLKAFPAALVGGLDSLLGAVAGSLLVAAAEVLVIQYVDPLLSDVVPFLVLLGMLMIRPWGLFGTPEELERV
ncbi:MAG: branched-chain amino acid ABC transporter permease [Stellaceae bacterium]